MWIINWKRPVRTGDLCATWAMTPMKRGRARQRRRRRRSGKVTSWRPLWSARIRHGQPLWVAIKTHQNHVKSCKIHHKIHQRYIALWENNGKCGKSWTHHWRWRLALATWKAWMLAKPCWLKLERSMFGMPLVDQVKEVKQFCSSAIKHKWKMNHLSLDTFQIFKDL